MPQAITINEKTIWRQTSLRMGLRDFEIVKAHWVNGSGCWMDYTRN